MADRRDVLIIGAGLNGATLALALARHGVTSHVVDAGDRAAMLAPEFDGRVTAVASSSMAMFDAIGLSARIDGEGCPIRAIRVADQLKPGELNFAPESGREGAGEPGDDGREGVLGLMFENRVMRRALFEEIDAEERIRLHMPARVAAKNVDAAGATLTLDNGRELSGALLVAAEGRGSPTRREAGFRVAEWDYAHVALVGAIHHEKPHEHVAHEIFWPGGPFALLPMNGVEGAPLPHRSAFVWTVPRAKAPGYRKLGDRGFLTEMQKAMGGIFGDIALAAPRMAYPLSFSHSAKVTGERLVLLGDAAHGIHPIAGQGLNLGLRDVATLAEVVVDGMRSGLDPGDPQLLARYERWRSLDVMAVAGSTDLLTHFFGLKGDAISAVRRAGLAMVQRAGPLKQLFMGTARGTSGQLPRLLTGRPI